jgi:hypothetical protein
MTNTAILSCAELCAQSYQDSDPRFVTVDELRYAVIPCDDHIDVCFRGTANAEGWLHDLLVLLGEDFDGSIVHLGFHKASHELMPYIHEALSRCRQDLPIRVSGHSLGGALACLTTKQLVATGFDATAITFGCPRYQSQLGRDPLFIVHYRIVNSCDPVTHVPDDIGWYHTVKPFIDVCLPTDELSVGMHSPIEDAYVNRLKTMFAAGK